MLAASSLNNRNKPSTELLNNKVKLQVAHNTDSIAPFATHLKHDNSPCGTCDANAPNEEAPPHPYPPPPPPRVQVYLRFLI